MKLPVILRVVVYLMLLTQISVLQANSAREFRVCYNFGCKTEDVVRLTDQEWREVTGWFKPAAATAELERTQIKQAIGWMEVVVGKHTPTHRDTGLDLNYDGEFPGQLDCIDESLNTTTYLKLFEQEGFLTHHKVLNRAYRKAIFDQHWAGQIEEVNSGDRFAVDSWFQRNGILPYVQPIAEWQDIPYFFSSYVDNSNEYDIKEKPKTTMWSKIKKKLKLKRASDD